MKDMGGYTPTIGLEVHAELKTVTKMFCRCLNNPDEKEPNVNICPVCMAHPGTLPTINKEAVKHILKMGIAVGGQLADFSEFDRKNYFYPDIPKGYQISQYQYPLVTGGKLAGVELTRIHLEEDTARSQHKADASLIDYNRAGLPLMELVTEPVVHDAKTAGEFARELQLLLRTLGAGEANMEKGQMRVEANISVSKSGTRGTKVEIKNLNSFRSVERAIKFEIDRQIKQLQSGNKVVQETRGWDEVKQETFSQRLKEESHDYRYFPDPDLPKLHLAQAEDLHKDVLLSEMSELPWERRARYISDFGLKEADAELLSSDLAMAEFFETSISYLSNKESIQRLSNYLLSDVRGYLIANDRSIGEIKMTAKSFVEALLLLESGRLSSRGAKDLLAILMAEGGEAEIVASEKGLIQQTDTTALETIIDSVIESHGEVVSEYRSGKSTAIQFLIGQAMKASRGSGNPAIFKELLERKLAQ